MGKTLRKNENVQDLMINRAWVGREGANGERGVNSD